MPHSHLVSKPVVSAVVIHSSVDFSICGHRLYQPLHFRWSHGHRVWHLCQMFDSFHSTCSVYPKRPTWHLHLIIVIQETRPVPPVLVSRVGRGRERSRGLQSLALSDGIATIERGILLREPAIRWLNWSFIPHAILTIDLYIQGASKFHQNFLWLQPDMTWITTFRVPSQSLATPDSAKSYLQKKLNQGVGFPWALQHMGSRRRAEEENDSPSATAETFFSQLRFKKMISQRGLNDSWTSRIPLFVFQDGSGEIPIYVNDP